MLGRREAILSTSNVEAHHVALARGVLAVIVHRKLGDLLGAARVAHGAQDQAHVDATAALGDQTLTLLHTLNGGFDDLLQGKAIGLVLLRGVAQLGVANVIGGQVLDCLTGDAHQPLGGLHNGSGVVESGEVGRQIAGVSRLVEPLFQLCGVCGGQLIADLLGELDQGGGAYAAVEVIVKLYFGKGRDDVRVNHVLRS